MNADGFEGRDVGSMGSRPGGSAFHGIALVALAAPFCVGWWWWSSVDDAAVRDLTRASRNVVGAEVLETRTSEGFAEVADEVANVARPPDWESLRSLLRRHRRVDLWYSVRVEWRLDDGGREETTYVRHPYHDREHCREFLRMVRGDGRTAAGVGAAYRLPVEDQGPIPDPIVDRLREARPWAR